jgi:hypothetical protein
MKKLLVLILIVLTACAPTPQRCQATERVTVHQNMNHAKAVDELEAGEQALVTARANGWYEITTARLVTGYVEASKCK